MTVKYLQVLKSLNESDKTFFFLSNISCPLHNTRNNFKPRVASLEIAIFQKPRASSVLRTMIGGKGSRKRQEYSEECR